MELLEVGPLIGKLKKQIGALELLLATLKEQIKTLEERIGELEAKAPVVEDYATPAPWVFTQPGDNDPLRITTQWPAFVHPLHPTATATD